MAVNTSSFASRWVVAGVFLLAATVPGQAEDFTLIAMPDTQFYAQDASPIFSEQTQWIVDNKDSMNIVYVAQLGDCVQNGNARESEWLVADAAFSLLEDPVTTTLADGLPYGIAVGNHDQSPFGNPDGTSTALYNQYFGASRFLGRAYYAGHYGTNNDNHFDLFSAGGVDFVVIYLEFDASPEPAVLDWAGQVLEQHRDRQVIVVSHYLIRTGNPGAFGPQGQVIYDALKVHPNLLLMLSGHVLGEGRRVDTFEGNSVHTLLADYQGRANGGNGWLRILEFSPATSEIRVRTYSPTLDRFETDADSEFVVNTDRCPGFSICAPGDFDKDGDVDLSDYSFLTQCYSGSGMAPPADCCLPTSGGRRRS